LNITDTSAKVHKRKVLDYLKSLTNGEQFDFIFADPPYVLIEYNEILEYIYENNLLKEDGIIVFEMENSKLPVIHKMFELIKEKHYGMTKFYFIKKIN
jgi:16S rRNA G966 N2-methylase RsmD